MHTLPNDVDQSHFRSFDSRTQTHSNNVCVDRPNFQFRSNSENQPQAQTKTRQTVIAKPDTYDGRSSRTDLITQFEIVCRLNNWSSEIKALQLAACFRGTARSVLTDLRPHQLDDYYELFVLQTRFEPKNQTKRKCASENIDEALNIALKYETFKMSRNGNTQILNICGTSKRFVTIVLKIYVIEENPKTNVSRSDPSNQRNDVKKYFYCGKPGHFQNKCRKRQFDLKSEKLNNSAHKINDNQYFVKRSEICEKSRDHARDTLNDQRLSL